MEEKSDDLTQFEKVAYGYSSDNNYLEEENRLLRETVSTLKKELETFKTPPLIVCEVRDIVGGKAVVRLPNGNEFLVEIASNMKGKLKAGDYVLADQKNLIVQDKIKKTASFSIEKFVVMERPTIKWGEVGGLTKQEEEIKEVIELPLKKPELFKKVGIQPPKGVLLYGPPGTGKTLLAKAVAASTKSLFIEIVGSELVQKFIGEGAKLVKEIFELAKSRAPAIIFIDELDAIASQRVDIGTSGEREVQRTFMQLLAEIDGFEHLGNVKVIGATNRRDILDPAITRPGRLDRLIKIPLPDEEGIKQIFSIHTKDMKLEKFDKKPIYAQLNEFSGAEIKAVCTEAGYFAIRNNRIKVTKTDFLKAIKKVREDEESEGEDFMGMFG
ncbi:AAA family ATPase [Candidatus Woesearchaeota archaeon]|nr:AAA family ATPase [Candidatus Woesearchaeota archaeon]